VSLFCNDDVASPGEVAFVRAGTERVRHREAELRQRKYRLKYASTYSEELRHYGLILLTRKRYRQ